MKQLFFRNILGSNPRKREVSLEEISDQTRMRVVKKWVSKYFVKEKFFSTDPSELRAWISEKKQDGYKRRSHILKRSNTKTGRYTILCKILGDFFIIWGNGVYRIVYTNALRIEMNSAKG